jgi:hypothetical protein
MSSSLNYAGHHGITLCGNDHLADNIRINTRFIHDLTVVSIVFRTASFTLAWPTTWTSVFPPTCPLHPHTVLD